MWWPRDKLVPLSRKFRVLRRANRGCEITLVLPYCDGVGSGPRSFRDEN